MEQIITPPAQTIRDILKMLIDKKSNLTALATKRRKGTKQPGLFVVIVGSSNASQILPPLLHALNGFNKRNKIHAPATADQKQHNFALDSKPDDILDWVQSIKMDYFCGGLTIGDVSITFLGCIGSACEAVRPVLRRNGLEVIL